MTYISLEEGPKRDACQDHISLGTCRLVLSYCIALKGTQGTGLKLKEVAIQYHSLRFILVHNAKWCAMMQVSLSNVFLGWFHNRLIGP